MHMHRAAREVYTGRETMLLASGRISLVLGEVVSPDVTCVLVVPGEPGLGDPLDAHGASQADVVVQDGGPGDEDPRGGEVDEPPEDGEGAAGEAEEAEEHECAEEEDAGVGGAPARGAEEDAGRLALEGEAVEDAGAGEEALVGGGPGRCDDDGVDDRGDEGDARGGGGDDEGGLGGVTGGAVGEAGVVAGDEHADDEDGEHVEEEDAEEDALAGGGDGGAGVPGLGGGHGDGLDAREGEDSAGEGLPEAEEVA